MYQHSVSPLYSEPADRGNPYRTRYLHSVDRLVRKLQKNSEQNRTSVGDAISANREAYRQEFRQMLGWPLTAAPEPVRVLEEIPVFENESCEIVRVLLEVLDDFQFYGIRMTHKTNGRLPYSIVQHGGQGTSEIVSSFFDSGNYNDIGLRIFHQGVHVFMPQLLLWKMPFYGEDDCKPEDQEEHVDSCRHRYDNALRQVGGSLAALEIYCISRVLDYLENRPEFNGHFGMAGLSYGGFYTLYTAAAEPRIQASLACSHFNDRIRYNRPDKVWFNAANRFLDAEVGALVCPRYLRIETGNADPLFDWSSAQAEYIRLRRYYEEAPEQLHFRVFDGNHEFCPEEDSVAEFAGVLKHLSENEPG